MNEAQRYGRYLLVKKLASGGMAQVWLARQSGIQGFEKLLVIKQVLAHLADDQSFIEMFEDEARLAGLLNHPNVVQVFDFGQIDESLYIAMEYIHGEDLRSLDRESRRARRPIPIPLVCRIIADAAGGLHYAHTLPGEDGLPLGLVHRDVSPQNIIATFQGGVKVVDFGIAKAADRAVKTRVGVLKGKYAYMSPEQASGKSVDARTDVFALGIILHELLTGRRLFKRDGDIATLHAVVSCEIEPPSHINPIVPPQLDPIVMSALEADPELRFSDAGSLQLVLEDFLLRQGEPASSAHLGVYMRELFAERLAIEGRVGGAAAYLEQRATGASRSLGSMSLRSRASRPETQAPGEMASESVPVASGAREVCSAVGGGVAAATNRVDGERSGALAPASDEPSRLELEGRFTASSLPELGGDDESSGVNDSQHSLEYTSRRTRRRMVLVGLVVFAGTAAATMVLIGDQSVRSVKPPATTEIQVRDASRLDAAEEPERTDDYSSSRGDRPDPVATGADQLSPKLEGAQTKLGPKEDDPESMIRLRDGTGSAGETVERDVDSADPASHIERGQRGEGADRRGTFVATVSPGASRVDIRLRGRWQPAGARPRRLSPGTYRVRVVLPDGATVFDQVIVGAGQDVQYRRAFERGRLQVVLQPFGSGGELRVDGRAVGQVPGPPVELYEGSHRVEVMASDGRLVRGEVVVRAGEQASLLLQFGPLEG